MKIKLVERDDGESPQKASSKDQTSNASGYRHDKVFDDQLAEKLRTTAAESKPGGNFFAAGGHARKGNIDEVGGSDQ